VRPALATAVVALLAATVLPGCGKRVDDTERLRNSLTHTRRLAARFDYRDDREGGTVTVQGLVEDDFRFKSRVFYNDQPGFDEVVADDVLAMRVLDPDRLQELVDPDATLTDNSTEIKGVTVIQALKSRRWVEDPKGAPVVSGLGLTEDKLGLDPAIDAVTAIDYSLEALKQSLGARRWDKDSVNPTYATSEDPFDKPEAGETRFDLVRPDLPSPSAARSGAGGQVAVPASKHFRKMAMYVKDGAVVRVEERIEVTGKSLREFVKWFDLYLREAKQTAIRQRVQKLVQVTPQNKLGQVLLNLLSEGLQAFGERPILSRSMSLRLEDLGSKVDITLPNEQLVKGDLSALVTSGAAKKPKPTTGSSGGPADSGSTGDTGSTGGTGDTTTTTAPAA
jgi:hypothetical protein